MYRRTGDTRRNALRPVKKCATDITELKESNGKLYVSAIFNCYDLLVCGLAMDTNMKASLCTETVYITLVKILKIDLSVEVLWKFLCQIFILSGEFGTS